MENQTETTEREKLSLSNYDVFGFDVDHTLAKYNIPGLFNLVNRGLSEYLVKEKGYGDSLLQDFDPSFCIRGIIYDMPLGNFLKLSENGTILVATHGTKFMTENDICKQYGKDKHWPEFEEMIETVNNIGDKFKIFENFFDMPIMMVCARIIDQLDCKNGEKLEKYDFWRDVFDAILYMYDYHQYKNHKGGLFPPWKENTAKYVEKCSISVKNWLKRLKTGNRKVFILTSSFNDFAVASLKHILGDDWKSYFDFVLTYARKPSFFKGSQPFFKVSDFCEKEKVETIDDENIFSQGNHKTLQECLIKSTGKENPRVLFFGDSLRSDAYPAKKYAEWDTVLILEEMVAECHSFEPEADVEVEPTVKKKRIAEPSDLEKEYLTSEKWGSFFTDGRGNTQLQENGKYMNTLWGFIVRKYADVVIPQLEYISDLSLEHEFDMFDHEVPLNLGFYPGLPMALQ